MSPEWTSLNNPKLQLMLGLDHCPGVRERVCAQTLHGLYHLTGFIV